MGKKLSMIFMFAFLSLLSYGAYLENYPIEIKQPNGEKIKCFITGDEFYNRLHDADGYTIIQNAENGYYYYAKKEGEELVPSDIKAEDNPQNLEKNLKMR